MIEDDLVDRVLAEGWRVDSRLHGKEHWAAVTKTGLELAETTGADTEIVFAFGWLHDTRRENEGRDPQHGPRAAMWARDLHEEGLLDLEDDRLALLYHALEFHAEGETSIDPTTGTCWDADRLHLPRVGTKIDPELLSTDAARARVSGRPDALT